MVICLPNDGFLMFASGKKIYEIIDTLIKMALLHFF